jgi:D-glycero-D-manno-heptose 1,7-bisphosphate phosphatase
MLNTAAAQHNISLTNSIMVGDKLSDVEAAIKAGLQEVVWFTPGFIESIKVRAAESKVKSKYCKQTSITLTHSLCTIINS